MGAIESPVWVAAAIPAAVRLAAEAGTEVDDVLAHRRPGGGGSALLARQVVRLEESAELTEVATDLAGLLWAECEDVPRIADILEEPAAQAALEAVAEARRLAAGRLADRITMTPPAHRAAVPAGAPTPVAASVEASAFLVPAPARATPAPSSPATVASPVTAAAPVVAAAVVPLARPEGSAPPRPVPTSSSSFSPAAGPGLRPVAGAVAAGAAAAAILLFGRHLRRA